MEFSNEIAGGLVVFGSSIGLALVLAALAWLHIRIEEKQNEGNHSKRQESPR